MEYEKKVQKQHRVVLVKKKDARGESIPLMQRHKKQNGAIAYQYGALKTFYPSKPVL